MIVRDFKLTLVGLNTVQQFTPYISLDKCIKLTRKHNHNMYANFTTHQSVNTLQAFSKSKVYKS